MNVVNVDRQVNPNHNGRSVELMEICVINGKLSINYKISTRNELGGTCCHGCGAEVSGRPEPKKCSPLGGGGTR